MVAAAFRCTSDGGGDVGDSTPILLRLPLLLLHWAASGGADAPRNIAVGDDSVAAVGGDVLVVVRAEEAWDDLPRPPHLADNTAASSKAAAVVHRTRRTSGRPPTEPRDVDGAAMMASSSAVVRTPTTLTT